MTYFIKQNVEELEDNLVKLISKDWMLVTAGDKASFNSMTASWGSIGFLWKKPVVFIFVRPQRYTYEFLEKNDNFTLTFFEEEYRSVLNLFGSKSGRDMDKVKETGITPLETENGNVIYKESKLYIECKKMYHTDIDPNNFYIPELEGIYPNKDYHRMYIGEIIDVAKRA